MVKSAGVSKNDKQTTDWWEAPKLLIGENKPYKSLYISNANILGNMLSAGENVVMLQLDKNAKMINNDKEVEMDYLGLIQQVKANLSSQNKGIQLCYCSVFEDCWKINTLEKATQPQAIEQCPAQIENVVF